MKKSVKTLMPIPNGHVVLSKETTAGDAAWISQEENGYEFQLAEYNDGTTALYRVNHDGSIDPDNDSVLVRKMFCLHCGERLNPALDAATGTPDPHDYYCAACGRHIEIGARVDELNELTQEAGGNYYDDQRKTLFKRERLCG